MKIMVFDVPAESGGALSVLNEFYNEYKLDEQNEYIFIVSLPELQETSNIKILRFPWIKKSWIHRLYFDHFIAPNLIKKYKVDKVVSLQNIIIPHTKVYQSLFVHNALPFSEYRFRFNEDRFLWFYQNIIGKNILKSIKKANHVIVQTNWMKQKCITELKISNKKIDIIRPKVNMKIKEFFKENEQSLSTFFYPASGVVFKNHQVIIEACLELKRRGINKYKVIFTLKGNESSYVKMLYDIVKKNELPIEFVGNLEQKQVFQLYQKSILIFPSYIETVGLPLIEAMMHKGPIISADVAYAREVLGNYHNVRYFDCFKYDYLLESMEYYLNYKDNVKEL